MLGDDVRGVVRVVAQRAIDIASDGSARTACSGSATPYPSRYEAWNDGERTKDISIERVMGGGAFRSSKSYRLLQMDDLIAQTLLKQEEEPSPRVRRLGVDRAFGILDQAFNRKAWRRDPQGGVGR